MRSRWWMISVALIVTACDEPYDPNADPQLQALEAEACAREEAAAGPMTRLAALRASWVRVPADAPSPTTGSCPAQLSGTGVLLTDDIFRALVTPPLDGNVPGTASPPVMPHALSSVYSHSVRYAEAVARRDAETLPDLARMHWAGDVASLARGASALDAELGTLERATHLVILRPRSVIEPVNVDSDRFVSGRWSGDAVVVDLSTGEALCGAPIEASSSTTVALHGVGRALAEDLRANVRRAATSQLTTIAPHLSPL